MNSITVGVERDQVEQEYGALKPEYFSLKTPYMVQGRVTPTVAQSDLLAIQVKVNAEGGENEIHAHISEDHAFIVLEGECTIFDKEGSSKTLRQYQGVMLKKGVYYRYFNSGPNNLVLLRVSSPPHGKVTRVDTDGSSFHDGVKNKTLPPIVAEGEFFAASAGLGQGD